jgi:hypothetical protein
MSWFRHDQKTNQYLVTGKTLSCTCCGSREFIRTEAQLHTQGLTFFQMEWLGKSVYVLVCSNCSRIEWFAEKPEEVTGT